MSETKAKMEDKQGEVDDLSTKIDKSAAKVAKLKEEVATLEKELMKIADEQKVANEMRESEKTAWAAAKADFEGGLEGVQMALQVRRDCYLLHKMKATICKPICSQMCGIFCEIPT